jgi:Uncharacterized protein conserved in bacteria
MRKIYYILTIVLLFTACTATKPVKKSIAYKGLYAEKPLTVLLMPPINKSTNVEAKEYFHSTLMVPLAEQGYYIIPPFLSMEILRKESAYDSELFLTSPLNKFGEVFGADAVLFTIINKWDKSSIGANVKVYVEYILKSTKTNEVLYNRKGEIVYDASVRTNSGGLAGLAVGMIASAINTASVKYVDVARISNKVTFTDFPAGAYSTRNKVDSLDFAGPREFKATVNSSYR